MKRMLLARRAALRGCATFLAMVLVGAAWHARVDASDPSGALAELDELLSAAG